MANQSSKQTKTLIAVFIVITVLTIGAGLLAGLLGGPAPEPTPPAQTSSMFE